MDSNFYNEEFEDLIRQKADQYKMYPSDKVWKNVHSSLHTRRKWFIAGMFTLITGILFFAGKELLAPSGQSNTTKKIADNNTPLPKKVTEVSIAPAFPEFKVVSSSSSSLKINNEIVNDDSINIMASDLIAEDPNTSAAGNLETSVESSFIIPARNLNVRRMEVTEKDNNTAQTKNLVPENMSPASQELVPDTWTLNPADKKQTSVLQNSAPYEIAALKKLNRKYWQLYLSPTASYRSLSGGDIYANMKTNLSNGPIAATNQNSNLNQYINNKPAVGFEVGGSFLYRLTRNISFKAGLQFNYSSYNINAYASNTQPATIALNSYYGYTTNTITSYTNIGTIGGKAVVNLQNQYYQLSAPVGFELRIMGNEKLQLHVGGTIQPTYLLNRNAYLLTADYTNYTQEPSLFRRWNVNGAVEAFISYKTGSIRWQIGPQFRYQLLSTYTSQYPISENLKEFGIKLGISKTIF